MKLILKWWSNCASMAITKMKLQVECRDVAFNAARVSDSTFETQLAFVVRGIELESLSLLDFRGYLFRSRELGLGSSGRQELLLFFY